MPGLIATVDTLITGPTLEPLDLSEVRKHRRFSSTALDTLFDLWIAAARMAFEQQTGRQVMDATWERGLDGFPADRVIELPRPPLQAVLGVAYDDGDGTEQILAADQYRVSAPAGPFCRRGRIALAAGASWPTTAAHAQAVRIRYLAGYGPTTGAVPELVKAALLLLVGHFHRFGEAVQEARTSSALQTLPLGAEAMIAAFRYTAIETLPPRGAPWAA